jgi:hypothetical protein
MVTWWLQMGDYIIYLISLMRVLFKALHWVPTPMPMGFGWASLLCIPVSSSKSESNFSDAGNALTKNRSGLKPSTVNDLLFVQSNQDLMYACNKHYTIFEYMGALWIAWVGIGRCWWLWSGMGTNSKENVGLWSCLDTIVHLRCDVDLTLVTRSMPLWELGAL